MRRLAFRVSEGVASAWPSPDRLGALRTLSHPGILGSRNRGVDEPGTASSTGRDARDGGAWNMDIEPGLGSQNWDRNLEA